jgi:hypothetical protein
VGGAHDAEERSLGAAPPCAGMHLPVGTSRRSLVPPPTEGLP